SSADVAAGFTYSYDFDNDGTFEVTGSTSAAATVPASYLADGPGTRVVHGRISDKDGGFSDYTTTLTVTNVAPTATLSNGGAVNEGSAATVTFSNPSDPSAADTNAGFHYSYALTTAALASTYAGATDGLSKQFTFNDNGSYTVYGRIFDKDG